ncbi:MAG: adenosine deaminase [Spirochaetales bacterium]|nr:adenosine deaminase [Spirochaetales bacterium]
MIDFINQLPKTELHLHIEGTLEPETMFRLAKRNGIELPYTTVEQIREDYNFSDLQSFLDIYYKGAAVLIEEEDFYELTKEYLEKAHQDNVKHVEIFFDPQTHTQRGIPFKKVVEGIHRALEEARGNYGLTSRLIMCFLKHLSEEEAIETLKEALPYKEWIFGVGWDSTELGNPPQKFKKVCDMALSEGFITVNHAGEEGPAQYIWDSIKELHIRRVDHGVRSIDDELLLEYLRRSRIPLTVCPLSNIKLCVFSDMKEHVIKKLLNKGLCVTVNSDDPAYFGGYINRNFIEIWKALDLSKEEIAQLAKNSFEASFLSIEKKQQYYNEIDTQLEGIESASMLG